MPVFESSHPLVKHKISLLRDNDITVKAFRELTKELKLGEEQNDINRYVFNTTNVDDIKIKLYKNIKSIHDKWVVGVEGNNPDIVLTNIFDRFVFIDRSYTDIADLFKIAQLVWLISL